MDYEEFLQKINKIKAMGYVPSHRKKDTGIGKTLEDLLELKENNIQGPDFSNYELKASRKGSQSMITLFTKKLEPDSGEKLWQTYGYRQRKVASGKFEQTTLHGVKTGNHVIPPKEKELHTTVFAQNVNSMGFTLVVSKDRITVKNDKNVECFYSTSILRETLGKKYANMVHVLADHKRVQSQEHFWYNEAYLHSGFKFETFMKLVAEGKIKVDIRIGHYPNGKPHDHGTGLRISPAYLALCFDSTSKILQSFN
jgi:hypothetical protein